MHRPLAIAIMTVIAYNVYDDEEYFIPAYKKVYYLIIL
jgi:hypothetical protein